MRVNKGFIPREAISAVRPDIKESIAWVPGSTPAELIKAAVAYGVNAPKLPTLEDILVSGDRFAVELYLTRTCALNCAGCSVPVSVRWAKEQRQGVDAWKALLEVLFQRGLRSVKFIGGEVGTLPWLPDITGFAIRTGMHVSIFTDGVPFLDNPNNFDHVMKEANGKVLWMTSVDFVPPTEVMKGMAGKDVILSRRYKAQRGIRFIEMVRNVNGIVIGHMMVHKPCIKEIVNVYDEVSKRGGLFSVGTMQNRCHLYQGRDPDAYTQALTGDDEYTVTKQLSELIAREDVHVRQGRRTIANSRAHIATTATVGIQQQIGCHSKEIGPPGVFAVMPDGSLRGCPVIMTQEQIEKCPGCAYAVFRDGDPRWSRYLGTHGFYQPPTDRADFPSLFYPHKNNDYLAGVLPWAQESI
ncbi:MAG: hypothetical protein AAB481_03985 [Patescibacteria group bacterium]